MLQLEVLLRTLHRLGNDGHCATSLRNCSEISACRDMHTHEVQPLHRYRLFTAFAWTFCAQQGGAFAATAPPRACSSAVLPFKAWPHSTDHPHAFKTGEKDRQGIYLLPGCEC